MTVGIFPVPFSGIQETLLDATGDIVYALGDNIPTRLAIGSTNQVLGVTGGVPAYQASSKSTLTTTGDILYASSANTPARLAIGSTDQVLKVTGGVPVWGTASSGSQTVLASGTLPASTTLSLTSISGSYKDLRLVVFALKGGNNGLSCRINNNTSANYGTISIGYGDGGFTTGGNINETSVSLTPFAFDGSASKNTVIANFPNYTDATSRKLMDFHLGGQDGVSLHATAYVRGMYFGTNAAITQIDLIYGSSYTGGTYQLIGIL